MLSLEKFSSFGWLKKENAEKVGFPSDGDKQSLHSVGPQRTETSDGFASPPLAFQMLLLLFIVVIFLA